jgi:hypothetical protein
MYLELHIQLKTKYWKYDANLHISFLFCYLRQLREANKLDKNLMLQMDNCWHDNKNKWFFGFLSHLVAFGWFDSVEIYYLRPGHFYEIMDSICFAPLNMLVLFIKLLINFGQTLS